MSGWQAMPGARHDIRRIASRTSGHISHSLPEQAVISLTGGFQNQEE